MLVEDENWPHCYKFDQILQSGIHFPCQEHGEELEVDGDHPKHPQDPHELQCENRLQMQSSVKKLILLKKSQ